MDKVNQTIEQLKFLNSTAHDLITQTDTATAIQNLLHKMLTYFCGNRAYVFEFNYDKQIAYNSYEVCAEDVRSEKDNLQDLPLETCAFWLKAFDRKKYIQIENVALLDNSRSEEKEILLSQGIKSLIAVPLISNNSMIGMVGIDDPTVNVDAVSSLLALGDYIVALIQRRNLEEKLDYDDIIMRESISEMPGGFARLQVDKTGKMRTTYINPGLCAVVGMSYEEIIEKFGVYTIAQIHPDDRPSAREAIKTLITTKQPVLQKYRLPHSNGSYTKVVALHKLIRDKKGQTFINVYYLDLPEDERLEEYQRELIENLPCGAAIYKYENKVLSSVYINSFFFKMLGTTHVDSSTYKAMDSVHKEDIPLLVTQLEKNLARGKSAECDLRLRHKDGHYLTFHVVGNPIIKYGVTLIYTTFTPISANELTYREIVPTALAAVMAASTDLTFVKDRNLKYICCSKAFANMAGIADEKDIVGKTDYDIFDKALAEQYRKDDEKVISTKVPMIDYVEELPTVDDVDRYSITSKYLLHDNYDNVIGLYGIGRDVTESREAYSRLKFLTDSLPGGIALYELSPKGVRYLYMSDGVWLLTEYSKEEYYQLTKDDALALIYHEDVPILKEQILSLASKGTPIDCQVRVHTKNGGFKWLNILGSLNERKGEVITVNTTLFDVTFRKLVELKLEASMGAMDVASSTNGVSFWLYDMDKHEIRQEFQSTSPLGHHTTFSNVPQSLLDNGIVAPESWEKCKQSYDSLHAGADSVECTIKLLNVITNKYEWQRVIYSRVNNSIYDGKTAIGLAFNVDTEMENLEHYQHELKLRQELVKDSIYYYEINLSNDVIEEVRSTYEINVKNNGKFDKRLMDSIIDDVMPEYADDVRNTLFPDALRDAWERGETSNSLVYRRKVAGRGIRWIKNTYNLIEKPSSRDVIAFLYVQDIDLEKKDQIALESIMDEEIESAGILEIKSGLAHFIHARTSFAGLSAHQFFDFKKIYNDLIYPTVIDEEKENFAKFFEVEHMKRVLKKEKLARLDYGVKTENNTIRRKLVRVFYLDNTEEEIVIIRWDITHIVEEEQRKKQELEKAVDIANKASQAKSDFLSRMSHDMRTPLNAILSFSGNELTTDVNETELREYLGKINAAGEYLLGIINDILDMSKIEQRKIVLNKSPYSLTEFNDYLKMVVGALCKDKKLSFSMTIENDDADCILVDKMRFNQVFINLLSNSVKFTPEGGKVEFTINAYYLKNGQQYKRFTVRDTGIGMSEEFLPHAFDSFAQEYRGDTVNNNQGTGLGLAIVKEIVGLMGGTINVESTLGKGTTFEIDLPIQIVVHTPTVSHTEEHGKNALKGLNLLLCEDNLLNTEIAIRLLTRRECKVTCAKDGVEGLETFAASPIGTYDLVLMDIRMPRMDGLQTTREIRKLSRPDAKTVPIVAMTADAFEQDAQICIEAGMNAHLGKPIKSDLLYKTIANLTKRK